MGDSLEEEESLLRARTLDLVGEWERLLQERGLTGTPAARADECTVTQVHLEGCAYILTRVSTDWLHELSERQKEVANLLLQGVSRKKLASRLGISVRTVDTHVGRIYEKCKVTCRFDLIRRLSWVGLESPVQEYPP